MRETRPTLMEAMRSRWHLPILFLVALPVFVWLRWEPLPWVRAELDAAGLGDRVGVDGAATEGLGLRLEGVHLRLTDGRNIAVERLWLRPDWGLLLRGRPALRVRLASAGLAGAFSLTRERQGRLGLLDVHLTASAEDLASLAARSAPRAMLPPLAGTAVLSGEAWLGRNGRPLSGKLRLDWRQAATPLLQKVTLGDFRLQAQSGKQDGVWQWRVTGGRALVAQGKGRLDATAPDPAMWRLTGSLTIEAHDPALRGGWMPGGRLRLELTGRSEQPLRIAGR